MAITFAECPVLRQPRMLAACLSTWGGNPCASLAVCLELRAFHRTALSPQEVNNSDGGPKT